MKHDLTYTVATKNLHETCNMHTTRNSHKNYSSTFKTLSFAKLPARAQFCATLFKAHFRAKHRWYWHTKVAKTQILNTTQTLWTEQEVTHHPPSVLLSLSGSNPNFYTRTGSSRYREISTARKYRKLIQSATNECHPSKAEAQ